MKKGLLIVAMMIGVSASAQDFNSKKGTPILPAEGDWSIGVNANSILEYFGNLMNGGNNAPSFDFTNSDQIITGRMMKTADMAYRAKLRVGLGSTKSSTLVPKNGSTTNETVEDVTKVSATNIGIGGGIQKYRGQGRLKGIYGAEAMIMLGGGKTTYEYGNALTDAFPGGPRTTEEKDGSTLGFQLRGFIGAEYFFAPKMSLGGEFGWGLDFGSTGEGEITSEVNQGAGTTSTTTKTGKSSSFGIDTDNLSGAINLNFYF
jgi:hypothetical protein